MREYKQLEFEFMKDSNKLSRNSPSKLELYPDLILATGTLLAGIAALVGAYVSGNQ